MIQTKTGRNRAETAPEQERIRTCSDRETWQAGFRMGQEAQPGSVIALIGDLGVGKTVFTQGFAAGLGIRQTVNSPTFTILQIYGEGRLPLYHFDVYRIGDSEEMFEIGWEDYVYGDGVCLIEWANLIPDLMEELPPSAITRITIEKDPAQGPDVRHILVEWPESAGAPVTESPKHDLPAGARGSAEIP